MKYVFYDSESVDIKHKYSFTFGYIVTDENFNIIKPCEDFVFDPVVPQSEWDWWAYKKLLQESYPINLIKRAKPFSHYYNKIKDLFKGEDVLCIGYEINEDVKYLLANCERDNLEPINFNYIDLRVLLRKLTGKRPDSLALEYVKYTHKPYTDAHRSSADAEMTMVVMKEALKKYKINLSNYINENTSLLGTMNGFIYGFNGKTNDLKNPRESSYERVGKSRFKKPKEGREDFIDKWTKNELLFTRFLDFVEPTSPGQGLLKDKKISLSLNYESTHFQNMLKLIQIITNEGGTYIKKGSFADIFVKEDLVYLDDEGNPRSCSRYKYVMESIEKEGKNIQIIEFDEFLSLLGLTKEELNSMPTIDVDYLMDDKYKKVVE